MKKFKVTITNRKIFIVEAGDSVLAFAKADIMNDQEIPPDEEEEFSQIKEIFPSKELVG